MKRSDPRGSSIADVLDDVLKRVDPEQQLGAYRLWTFWNEEVGDAIAQRAQPTRFRNGILFVTVATHTWMQELRFMKDDILDKLNARLGAQLVRDIFFVSGSVDPPPQPEPEAPEPLPKARHLIALPPIADPALATAFSRVIEARAKRIARSQAQPKKTDEG